MTLKMILNWNNPTKILHKTKDDNENKVDATFNDDADDNTGNFIIFA